jgi:chromosome partitioning protein
MLIALCNPKGGVGKSTIATHLAAHAREQGRKVALIDADAQESSSAWLADLADSGFRVEVYRYQTADEILDHADEAASKYDLVVADGPGALKEVTRALLMVCDIALLPIGPGALDLRASLDSIRVLRQAQKVRRGPPRAAVIPNKLHPRYRLSRELLDAAAELKLPTLAGLSLRQAYADSAGQGTVVWRMGPAAQEAAQEMLHLINQIYAYETTNHAY